MKKNMVFVLGVLAVAAALFFWRAPAARAALRVWILPGAAPCAWPFRRMGPTP